MVKQSLTMEDAANVYGCEARTKARYVRREATHRVVCEYCGRVTMSHYARARFCPAKVADCQQLAQRAKEAERKVPLRRTCEECGAEFETCHPEARFCGSRCKSTAYRRRRRSSVP